MPKIIINTTAKTAFGRWIERHGLSVRDVSEALAVSPTSVVKWKSVEAPRCILLACVAYSLGLDPIG